MAGRKRGNDATVVLVLNSYEGPVGFNLPKVPESKNWRLLVDTNSLNKDSSFAFGETYEVTGHSFLCFLLEGAKPPA
jgi:isoamylase